MALTLFVSLQIDVAVNAPEAGIIKEFLVNEEDTVTVGQDIVRLELGSAPAGEKQASSESKETASEADKAKTEAPAQSKQEESKPAPTAAPEKKATPAPKQESKPAQATKEAPATLGNREERRVSNYHYPCVHTERVN